MPAAVPVEALREPIALPENRISRFYAGGRMIGRFRGDEGAVDDGRPEDWVGSATPVWTAPDATATKAGISGVDVDGVSTTIADLVAAHPEAMVGPELVARVGPSPSVLVKLLDAGQRLPVHCHPTREAADRILGSRFGKTEAWLILGTRSGGAARVWAGFREPIDRPELRRLIDDQEVDALLGLLVEHEVTAGDVILVPGGTPHAIGSGIFLLELQEPTDFSIVAETRGFPIDDAGATLGLGWDRAIEFFEATPAVRGSAADGGETAALLPRDAAPYFRLLRQRLGSGTGATPPFDPAYAVGVVLRGAGVVHGEESALGVAAGGTFALAAAAVPGAELIAGQDGLEVAWCLGPEADSLVSR